MHHIYMLTGVHLFSRFSPWIGVLIARATKHEVNLRMCKYQLQLIHTAEQVLFVIYTSIYTANPHCSHFPSTEPPDPVTLQEIHIIIHI
jgi:hypothetical protein